MGSILASTIQGHYHSQSNNDQIKIGTSKNLKNNRSNILDKDSREHYFPEMLSKITQGISMGDGSKK